MNTFKVLLKIFKSLFLFVLVGIFVFMILYINDDDSKTTQERRILKNLIKEKNILNNLFNDYNQVFLPKTQFVDLGFEFQNIDVVKTSHCYAKKCKTFFIEKHNENLFILARNGELFYTKIDDFINGNKKFSKILTNIDFDLVLDLYIKEDFIYISGNKKVSSNSYDLSISKAKINNLEKINFTNLFVYNDPICTNNTFHSGKIKHLNDNIQDGVLFATMSVPKINYPRSNLQSDKTNCGKILLIDEKTSKVTKYAKGFRNVIGLYTENNLVIATDHGPRGGDEINNVKFGLNYGWPIASYGDLYLDKDKKKNLNYQYSKDHENLGFVEPIFSFIPSIGISEIIRLPNNFSKLWQNNFLLTSLNKKTLYRIKFDKKFEKIIFFEEIFIGDRIRDILYLKKHKKILLSLELDGKILILENKIN